MRYALVLYFCLIISDANATPVNIVDILYRPSGNPPQVAAGTDITITQSAFTNPAGNYYPAFQLTPHPVSGTDGSINIWLEPNVSGQPYTILYRATNGVITREFWTVPVSMTPLKIVDVRTSVGPTPPVGIVQLGQLAQGGALQGYVITWNNTLKRWEADAPASGIPPGNSGGIPYYNSSTTVASTPAWTLNAVMVGGGAGQSPVISNMTYEPFFGNGRLTVPGTIIVGGAISSPSGNLQGQTIVATTTMAFGVAKVSDLPFCAFAEGMFMGATDLLNPTFLGIAAGGGGVHAPVYCNGTNWIVY